jgi:hypothetical protein
MGYCVARTWRSFWMPNERQNVLPSKRSLRTHRCGVLHAATSTHAYLRSYMVSPRHISSDLLTTFLSVVFGLTFRSSDAWIRLHPSGAWSFSFSPKSRLGGVCRRAHCLRARKILWQQLRHGLCCAHPPLPLARVAHMVSPAVLLAAKFARRALATSKGGVEVHWLGGWLCFGGGLGRGVAEGANTTQ